MGDDNQTAALLQRLVDLMENQVHGGQTGLGTPKVGGAAGFDPKQFNTLINNVKQSGAQFGMFNKILKQNQTASSQVFDSLQDLDNELKALSETAGDVAEQTEKRSLLTAKRKELADAAARNTLAQTTDQFRTSINKSAGVLAAGVGKVISGLTSGSSAFDVSSGILNAGLDIAGETSKTAGNAIGAVGTTMANSTNKGMRALGTFAAIAGPAIGSLGEAASKAAKFGVDILTKEVEKNIKAFQTATSAGAMYADGMTGLNNAATNAGLTVDKFANMLSKHSADLAASGLGVGEGAALVGRVAKELRQSGVQTQLQKLGFGIEEQAGLIAETTANMRRSAGGKQTQAEIATQTAKYAESLRTIAAITGEDAKKKTDEAKAQNQILAFQQEMAKKSPEQRAAIDAAMATMTEQDRKNFRDRAVFGTVINAEGAIFEATVAGAREKGEAQFALLQQGIMTAEANAKLNADFGAQIRESILAQQAFGAAGMAVGGIVGEVSKSMLDSVNQANAYTKDAAAAAAEAIAKQKQTTDDLTKGVVAAEVAMLDFAVKLQELMIAPMGKYAKFTGEMLTSMQTMIDAAMAALPDSKESTEQKKKDESFFRAPTKTELTTITTLLGGAAGGLVGGGITLGAGAVPGAVSGALAGQSVGSALSEWFDLRTGKAKGGIASGPTSGYLEKLHGNEAVVPLPDGKTIPVKLTTPKDITLAPPVTDLISTSNQVSIASLASVLTDMTDWSSGLSQKLSQPIINKFESQEITQPNLGFNPTALINDIAKLHNESQFKLEKAIESLLGTAKDSLDMQDDMLRAMNDTKDATERLYNVLS